MVEFKYKLLLGDEHQPRQFEYHPEGNQILFGTCTGRAGIIKNWNDNDDSLPTTIDLGYFGTEMNRTASYFNAPKYDPLLGLSWLRRDLNKLVTGSARGRIVVSSADGSNKQNIDERCGIDLTSVSISCDDSKLLVSGYSQDVKVYNLETGQVMSELRNAHDGYVNISRFCHHSPHILATSSFDKSVKLWDLRLPLRRGHDDCIYRIQKDTPLILVTFSNDDTYFMTSGVDNAVSQHFVNDGQHSGDLKLQKMNSAFNYSRAYYSSSSSYVFTGSSEESCVSITNPATGDLLTKVELWSEAKHPALYIQSLRGSPVRDDEMSVLCNYRSIDIKEIVRVRCVSDEDHMNPLSAHVTSAIATAGTVNKTFPTNTSILEANNIQIDLTMDHNHTAKCNNNDNSNNNNNNNNNSNNNGTNTDKIFVKNVKNMHAKIKSNEIDAPLPSFYTGCMAGLWDMLYIWESNDDYKNYTKSINKYNNEINNGRNYRRNARPPPIPFNRPPGVNTSIECCGRRYLIHDLIIKANGGVLLQLWNELRSKFPTNDFVELSITHFMKDVEEGQSTLPLVLQYCYKGYLSKDQMISYTMKHIASGTSRAHSNFASSNSIEQNQMNGNVDSECEWAQSLPLDETKMLLSSLSSSYRNKEEVRDARSTSTIKSSSTFSTTTVTDHISDTSSYFTLRDSRVIHLVNIAKRAIQTAQSLQLDGFVSALVRVLYELISPLAVPPLLALCADTAQDENIAQLKASIYRYLVNHYGIVLDVVKYNLYGLRDSTHSRAGDVHALLSDPDLVEYICNSTLVIDKAWSKEYTSDDGDGGSGDGGMILAARSTPNTSEHSAESSSATVFDSNSGIANSVVGDDDASMDMQDGNTRLSTNNRDGQDSRSGTEDVAPGNFNMDMDDDSDAVMEVEGTGDLHQSDTSDSDSITDTHGEDDGGRSSSSSSSASSHFNLIPPQMNSHCSIGPVMGNFILHVGGETSNAEHLPLKNLFAYRPQISSVERPDVVGRRYTQRSPAAWSDIDTDGDVPPFAKEHSVIPLDCVTVNGLMMNDNDSSTSDSTGVNLSIAANTSNADSLRFVYRHIMLLGGRQAFNPDTSTPRALGHSHTLHTCARVLDTGTLTWSTPKWLLSPREKEMMEAVNVVRPPTSCLSSSTEMILARVTGLDPQEWVQRLLQPQYRESSHNGHAFQYESSSISSSETSTIGNPSQTDTDATTSSIEERSHNGSGLFNHESNGIGDDTDDNVCRLRSNALFNGQYMGRISMFGGFDPIMREMVNRLLLIDVFKGKDSVDGKAGAVACEVVLNTDTTRIPGEAPNPRFQQASCLLMPRDGVPRMIIHGGLGAQEIGINQGVGNKSTYCLRCPVQSGYSMRGVCWENIAVNSGQPESGHFADHTLTAIPDEGCGGDVHRCSSRAVLIGGGKERNLNTVFMLTLHVPSTQSLETRVVWTHVDLDVVPKGFNVFNRFAHTAIYMRDLDKSHQLIQNHDRPNSNEFKTEIRNDFTMDIEGNGDMNTTNRDFDGNGHGSMPSNTTDVLDVSRHDSVGSMSGDSVWAEHGLIVFGGMRLSSSAMTHALWEVNWRAVVTDKAFFKPSNFYPIVMRVKQNFSGTMVPMKAPISISDLKGQDMCMTTAHHYHNLNTNQRASLQHQSLQQQQLQSDSSRMRSVSASISASSLSSSSSSSTSSINTTNATNTTNSSAIITGVGTSLATVDIPHRSLHRRFLAAANLEMSSINNTTADVDVLSDYDVEIRLVRDPEDAEACHMWNQVSQAALNSMDSNNTLNSIVSTETCDRGDDQSVRECEFEVIYTHQAVLCVRSHYFAALLRQINDHCGHNMDQDDLNFYQHEVTGKKVMVIEVPERTRSKEFKALIRFIYCGVLEGVDEEDALELAVLANKYGVDDLLRLSEGVACANIRRFTHESIVPGADLEPCLEQIKQVLLWADAASLKQLKHICFVALKQVRRFVASQIISMSQAVTQSTSIPRFPQYQQQPQQPQQPQNHEHHEHQTGREKLACFDRRVSGLIGKELQQQLDLVEDKLFFQLDQTVGVLQPVSTAGIVTEESSG